MESRVARIIELLQSLSKNNPLAMVVRGHSVFRPRGVLRKQGGRMPKIKSITLKCGHCGTHNKSMIFIGSTEILDALSTSGNTQNCVSCGNRIKCNKENYSYVLADGSGGAVAPDFNDNKAP